MSKKRLVAEIEKVEGVPKPAVQQISDIQWRTGIICVMDALGSKGVWTRQGVEAHANKLKKLHDQIQSLFDESKEEMNAINLEMNYAFFSDTVIISMGQVKNKDTVITSNLLPYFSWLIEGIFCQFLKKNIFMRGAISYGDYLSEGSIILGPAIDDAASLHDQQNMMGLVFTPSASLSIDKTFTNYAAKQEGHDLRQHSLKYNTPLKKGGFVELYQVNWPLNLYKQWYKKDKMPKKELLDLFAKNPIPLEAYPKYENTIAFFDKAISANSTYLKQE